MATSRLFVQITDKEINKIKITCVKIIQLKQLFVSSSSRWIFPDNHLTFGE